MNVATPFDFTKSRSLESRLETRVSTWMGFFCKNPARLERSLGMIPSLEANSITTGVFSEFVADWAGPTVGCNIRFGPDGFPTLLVIPGTMARALVDQMLGAPIGEEEDAGDDPKPRELTRVEQSMIEMFVTEVCAALIEAWPEADPPSIVCGEVEPNAARSRFVVKTAELISVPFSLTIGPVTAEIEWLLPPIAFGDFEETAVAAPTLASRRNLEELVRGVPVELVVELGEARMSLRDLAQLKTGDLIVLDKKLGQPLDATIGKRARFIGWPGRIGNQQAYQVEELASRQNHSERNGGTD